MFNFHKTLGSNNRIQAIILSFGIIVYTFHCAVKTTSLDFMLKRKEGESGVGIRGKTKRQA